MRDHTTDREHLTKSAYATGANLAARQSIYRFQQPRFHFPDWALAHADWQDIETVVDIGCGNGAYLRCLSARVPRLLGLDLSRGMLTDLMSSWNTTPFLAVADAQATPVRSRCADLALSMHMLYHVADIAAAVHELRRVLRPGGVLLASTNAEAHLRELFQLLSQAFATLGGDSSLLDRSFMRFTAENGGRSLRQAFAQVDWYAATSTLAVPEVQPIVDYIESMRGWVEPLLPAAATWSQCTAEIERLVHRHLAHNDAFRITAAAGVFVCR